jgi:hypothetical protein
MYIQLRTEKLLYVIVFYTKHFTQILKFNVTQGPLVTIFYPIMCAHYPPNLRMI